MEEWAEATEVTVRELVLPQGCLSFHRSLGENGRIFCGDVSRVWLRALAGQRRLPSPQLPQPSEPLVEVVISAYPKRNAKALPLQRSKLCLGKPDFPMSYSQLLQYVSQMNHRNLWRESHKRRRSPYAPRPDGERSTVNVVDYDAVLVEAVLRLYGCRMIKIRSDPADRDSRVAETISPKSAVKNRETHPNIVSAICAVDGERNIYVIHHSPPSKTLVNCFNSSPALLDKNCGRKLLIVYQMLQAMKSAYDRGLCLGEVGPEDVHFSENLWIQIIPDVTANLIVVGPEKIVEKSRLKSSVSEPGEYYAKNCRKTSTSRSEREEAEKIIRRDERISLEKLCDLWVKGCLSNLDYVIHLNVLAGRKSGDPNAYHIVPWVTDFSSRCGKQWRDLTKSKYRLNKGDNQLDMTFDSPAKDFQVNASIPLQIPHHVSDVLSDITFYVYMARRTSKDILRQHVRQTWVPAEYPSSIQRMQEWTPDECIPEYYTDPTVFRSIHEDLPDLGIPAWATCVEDFVMKHRESLESLQVSESLHHWIDLTFGFKLSGTAAIKAKNVCLSLIDGHTELNRAGPVQLFNYPHPSRISYNSQGWGEKLPPRIVWHREKKKTPNEVTDDVSDHDDAINVPQNLSSLSSGSTQRRLHGSSSRNKSCSSNKSVTGSCESTPREASSSPSPSNVNYKTDNAIGRHHYKVQKSEIDQGIIYLPKEFNPISQLTAVENLHNFKLKTFFSLSEVNENAKILNNSNNSVKSCNFMNLFDFEHQGESNSFTNQMFEQQNYFKRITRDSSDHTKEKKDRTFNTRYVTKISHFKEAILLNRKKDMQMLGCLIVELFLYPKLRPLLIPSSKDFNDRYKACRLVLKNNIASLPTSIMNVACLLLQVNQSSSNDESTRLISENPMANSLNSSASDVYFPSISSAGLPPPSSLQLLQPLLSNLLLPFSNGLPALYMMLATLHEFYMTEREIDILCSFECNGQECTKFQSFDKTRFYFIRKIAESKVQTLSIYLENNLHKDSSFSQFNSIDLILPYFTELLKNKETCILAAWYLFDPIAKALGPIETKTKLFKLIAALYDERAAEKKNDKELIHASVYSNKKSVKLYHNIFLLRLIIRFGLKFFLENFITHLVEAVGGYKDYPTIDDVSLHMHNTSVTKPLQNSMKKLNYCDDSSKNTLNAYDIVSPDTSYGSEHIITPGTDKECLNVIDKLKRTNIEAAPENDVFHFECESSKEASTPKSISDVDSVKSWDFNKSKIKCLLEEIDLECSSPNLENYLEHAQAVEATESTCVINEREGHKSNNPCTEIKKNASLKQMCEKNKKNTEKLNSNLPSINVAATCQTFTSYVKLDDDKVDENDFEGNTSESKLNFVMTTFGKDDMKDSTELVNQFESTNTMKDFKVSEMTSESLIWLGHRLGPVLTCRYITRNLLKMLTLCYIGQENLLPANDVKKLGLDSLCIANGCVVGDKNAEKVIECLTSIAALYGEQLILLQYFPHMGDLIASCRKRITAPLEGGLIACLQLLRFLIPFLSDVKLMEQLQDIILKNILHPIVRLISSTRSTFPNGHVARSALARKFLETLYIISLRIGPEMTRKHLCVPALQRFCLSFDKVFENQSNMEAIETTPPPTSFKEASPLPAGCENEMNDEGASFLEICRDGTTAEWRIKGGMVICEGEGIGDLESSPSQLPDKTLMFSVMEEIKAVFTCELAHQSFQPFAKFIGEDVLERSLKNFNLLKQLCERHENSDLKRCKSIEITQSYAGKSYDVDELDGTQFKRSESISFKKPISVDETSNANSFGSNIAIVGNRIDVQNDLDEGNSLLNIRNDNSDILDIVSFKMESGIRSSRHLRGDWLMYWEHEIGRSEKDTSFNLKQIKLQTFSGHTHSVRNIICLDNENSFMTGSKDKTIKLWSLRNQGDGTAVSSCQWTYNSHKKGILSMSFLESHRLTVSTDSIVHIWDPYVESTIAQLDNAKIAPVSIVKAMEAPSSLILAATTDTALKMIDVRTCSYTHELKVTLNSNTFIRCICVSPSGKWVAIGLATGHLSLLDPRTGVLISYWKGHDGEVLQLVTMNENTIVSSSLDQTVSVWSSIDGKLKLQLKGSTEPVHCLATYYSELISGTTNNRIAVHTSIEHEPTFCSTKLRSDTFKGVLTSMAVLPLNRMLLLGGESGNVSLLC